MMVWLLAVVQSVVSSLKNYGFGNPQTGEGLSFHFH